VGISIIIPCHNRTRHLRRSLASLPAAIDGARAYYPVSAEVIVCYPCGEPKPLSPEDLTFYVRQVAYDNAHGLTLGPDEPTPFWKTRALNAGIEESSGSFLFFFDADTIFGPKSLACWPCLMGAFTKVAFRVIRDKRMGPHIYQERAFEAYNRADNNISEQTIVSYPSDICVPPECIFGNSQFGISRKALDNLRFDERYIGRGFEDIDMNRRIAEAHGDSYACLLWHGKDKELHHIHHDYTPGYACDRWNARNERRYYQRPCHWYVCETVTQAENLRPPDKIIWQIVMANEPWRLSAVIDGLDTVEYVK
jgi:glycosyltransferase involved in cell wall biosynthesis